MASSPLLRVGLRCSLSPMRSMKYSSVSRISFGECPLRTFNSSAIMPFTISASLSAVNINNPSWQSHCIHTRLWQPSIRFCSVLYFSSRGASSLPKSMSIWYLSIQSVKSSNSSMTSSCSSLIVISLFLVFCFHYLEELVVGSYLTFYGYGYPPTFLRLVDGLQLISYFLGL